MDNYKRQLEHMNSFNNSSLEIQELQWKINQLSIIFNLVCRLNNLKKGEGLSNKIRWIAISKIIIWVINKKELEFRDENLTFYGIRSKDKRQFDKKIVKN